MQNGPKSWQRNNDESWTDQQKIIKKWEKKVKEKREKTENMSACMIVPASEAVSATRL
jgi:hypothetical protein